MQRNIEKHEVMSDALYYQKSVMNINRLKDGIKRQLLLNYILTKDEKILQLLIRL